MYYQFTVFSERMCRRPSVCLSSVTFVRTTQAIESFGNISTLFGTLAIRLTSMKHFIEIVPEEPFRRGRGG